MERMKMKFIIAVTERLSAAAESGAKVELIEGPRKVSDEMDKPNTPFKPPPGGGLLFMVLS